MKKFLKTTGPMSFRCRPAYFTPHGAVHCSSIMADLIFVSAAVCVLLTLYVLKAYYDRARDSDLPLPPGPKGLFLVGNINDLPPPGIPEFQHWFKHKDCHGPLSSVTILGETIVIIHDINVASELMEKRANIHSGRPRMRFVDM